MPFEVLDVAAAPRELVAVGGVLDPATLRAAYRNGGFRWPQRALPAWPGPSGPGR